MKRKLSKVITPALLATSMVVNSMSVNVLAATEISSASALGLVSESEDTDLASVSKDYEVEEYEVEEDSEDFVYADEDEPEEKASPSNLKRISNEIMTLALDPGTHDNPAKTAEELAEALGGSGFAVADGNEVTLQQTVYLTNDLFIGASEEPITVDLGSYNIQLGDENQILLWSNKAEGTYADVTFTGDGKISNNGIYSTIQIYAGGNLTIDGVTVENGYDAELITEEGAAGAAIATNVDSCTEETETNITIASGNVIGSQGINFCTTGASDSLTISGGTVTGKLGQGVIINTEYKGASGVTNFDLENDGKVVSEADNFSAVNAFGEASVVVSGGTIKATGENSTGINIYGESSVTIEEGQISGTEIGIGTYDNSEIDVNGGEVSGRYGALSYGGGTLRVTSGTIRGTAAAVAGNGTDENKNTTIEIEGGTLEGGIAGIYHPQKGKLTITGGTITGQAGIVARGGDITISDEAEIEATGTGTITIGDAKHSGSSVKVPASAIVADQNTGYDSENMKVTISGGTIKAAEGESAVVMTTNGTEDSEINHEKFDITGGAFTNPGTSFAKYVDDEYVAANKGEETVVGEDLQAVVEALGVTSGDTLTVEKAPEGSSVSIVDADVTIDNQSGNDVTVNNHEITTGNEYTTSEDDFVAKINDAGYASLQDAVTHAQPGDTINLLTDITLENTVDITKTITLDYIRSRDSRDHD